MMRGSLLCGSKKTPNSESLREPAPNVKHRMQTATRAALPAMSLIPFTPFAKATPKAFASGRRTKEDLMNGLQP